MIRIRLTPELLGGTRFAFSPLAEVGASLRLLNGLPPPRPFQAWMASTRDVVAQLDADVLSAIAPDERWAASFLFPSTAGRTRTIQQQLHGLRSATPDMVLQQLNFDSGRDAEGHFAALGIKRSDIPERAARALWGYWKWVVEPYWPRMHAVLQDDVSFRSSAAASGGLLETLGDLHPEVSVEGDFLCIDKPWHSDCQFDAARLTLVPSIFIWPRLVVNEDEQPLVELTYPARGIGRVWGAEQVDATTESALGALIGRNRAQILMAADVPMSTTQIAIRLGQSPGAISQHLSVLRRSGMVVSWRSGRNVLYRQTALARSFVAANTPDRDAWDIAGRGNRSS